MHGTLEVKQDALTADAVKRPEWMDEVAAEDMTEEQKKVGNRHSDMSNAPGIADGTVDCMKKCPEPGASR